MDTTTQGCAGREPYDSRLDRTDVAVRAIARICRWGQRWMLQSAGITTEQREQVIEAVAVLDHSLSTKAGVIELTQVCPFVLERAVVLQVSYQGVSAVSREWYYARHPWTLRKRA